MRTRVLAVLLTIATPAAADTFGGFSSVDAPYLVNQDRVCTPLEVKDGQASGAPSCSKAAADEIAHLTIKDPVAQRGPKATFTASATGKTLTITRGGDVVVTWNAFDPIGKVVDVYASPYEDRVAVAYTTRRLGKEVTDVVAFVLVKTTGKSTPVTTGTSPITATQPAGTAAPEDPKITKAVEVARKAMKGKAEAAWQGVLALDADHSEARFQLAKLAIAAKKTGDAIAALEQLAKSARGDAIEWLVEARFDAAFAPVRADARYRAAVGLDRPAKTPYEHLMGFGGQWEQVATCGEKPEVHMTTNRDRTVKLRVKVSCNGGGFDVTYKGTWRFDADQLTLVFPTKGQAASKKDEAECAFKKQGDEDALHCALGKDLDFDVLPTRR